MFLTESFPLQLDDLLHRVSVRLQISRTQHRLAEERYIAVGRWLEGGSALSRLTPRIYPQGSLLIGTTVRPKSREEYDLDLVCELQADWRKISNPIVLLDSVEARLREHEAYRSMIERRNRCVCLQYAGEFHLDILPGCPDISGPSGSLMIADREVAGWKASNPKGFAAWFEDRAATFDRALIEKMAPLPAQQSVEIKPPLKRAVQLLKRWRDIRYAGKDDLAPISIVLTTLAAQHYRGEGSVNEALSGIVDSIVRSLPRSGQRLIVLNPMNRNEDLSERWDEHPGSYEAFVDGIVSLQQVWKVVTSARGIPEINGWLERLFGEDVAKMAVKEQIQLFENARRQRQLGVRQGTGMLGGAAATGFTAIKPNTFYGA